MPIHDQSYRHYAGGREAAGRAWLVIAWAGIRSMIGKRKFLGLLLLAWLPFLIEAIRFYFAANFPQVAMLAAILAQWPALASAVAVPHLGLT